jgi:hypothetical protein
MSDPTDTGQRNPLSSSSSHASGTSARRVSIQADQAPGVTSMEAQDDVAAPAPLAGGEADLLADPEYHAAPKLEAEAGPVLEAEISQPETTGWSDEPTAQATEQQELADEPETAEFEPSPEPAPEPVAEPHVEDQPLIAAEASAVNDELVATAEKDEPADTRDEGADLDAAAPDTPSSEYAAADSPLPNSPSPDAVAELRAAARQKLAENEARQAQAMALFDQVSRRFTAALEEAGVDAARVTFKVMEFAQASLKNNLELAKSYTAARSVPDIFGLHAAYLTRQFELLNAQAEELRELTAKFAQRNTAALKSQADMTVKTLDHR